MLALIAAALVALPASAQTVPSPQPTPAPAVAAPSPLPLPAPSSPPSPAASLAPEPVASTTPQPYAYIVTPPPAAVPLAPDAPQILEVDVNDKTLHPGGPVNVRVRTTANIVAVEARAFGRFVPIPPAGPQTYALQYVLPCCLPFWLTGRNYDVTIAAGTADGRQTTLVVPLILARQ
jgi:hypothetical protein